MAEEQGYRHHHQEVEGHGLCANNCGFFGTPATRNLCSKCYRDLRLKEERESAVERSLRAPAAAASPPSCVGDASSGAGKTEEGEPSAGSTAAGRCSACRRRVGLAGFVCRCGGTFCGVHRYPERHACGFDFRAAGREGIARANPVVKAEKLDKI